MNISKWVGSYFRGCLSKILQLAYIEELLANSLKGSKINNELSKPRSFDKPKKFKEAEERSKNLFFFIQV
ncbi:hypothetical protein RclHR1_01890007 [Rhizophagus clarus]|uniref:Uncharacterized protein n=1 Tax=Rhizophagus clarus TaxID=94130 RepID=A0A2Z6QMK6_9GLOM|nr:hypothetical protein RclHR1_01890007 [Rhizophagus clarus]